jgi:hypothetical protein
MYCFTVGKLFPFHFSFFIKKVSFTAFKIVILQAGTSHTFYFHYKTLIIKLIDK